MSNPYRLTVDAIYKGGPAFQKAQADLAGLNRAADMSGSQKAIAGMNGLHVSALAAAGAVGAVAVAMKKSWDAVRAGSVLQTTQQRFDKLAESIGSTADTMLGKLRTATQGMVADFDLMSSASQIISLRLADNEEQVIRLATVAGTLNWDMQQVILTFANMSTMRLDALGLSVEEVTTKAKELEKAGLSAQAAFKEAVIQAGETRLGVAGLSEAEQSFKMAEAAARNYKDSLLQSIAATLEQAGAFDLLRASAEKLNAFNLVTTEIEKLVEAQKITSREADGLHTAFMRGGQAAYDNALKNLQLTGSLTTVSGALGDNVEAYRNWSGATATAMDIAAAASESATRSILIDMDAIKAAAEEAIRLFGGAASSADAAMLNSVSNWQMENNVPGAGNPSRRAYWQYEQMKKAAEATRGYSGAVSQAVTAEQALAASHARLADAFMSEFSQKAEDGLINEAGVVNIENANKALMEQAKQAGATASQLAMLGLATGAMSQEQAEAALKAAILAEKAKQIAQYAVATGDIGGAAGSWAAFQEALNSGQIEGATGGVEGLAGAVTDLAEGGPYTAELAVENDAALAAINEAALALANLTSGTYNISIGTTTTGGIALPTVPGGGSDRGGFVALNKIGPIVPVGSPYGSQTRDVANGKSGGASNVTVSVVNYVNGQQVERSTLDTLTEDKMTQALNRLGLGRR